MLTEVQIDALVEKLKDMIVNAKGRFEITAPMLKRSSRCKACLNVIRDALHSRNIYLYAMRWKPELTEEDIADRWQFGWDYMEKPRNWWATTIHLCIDVKFFGVFLNPKARIHVAQSGCRGVYRGPGEGLNEGCFKPNPKLKYNTGAKGMHVLAGVGNGKVLVWEYIDGNWNSSEAVRLYKGAMLKDLQKEYLLRRRYTILEDSDPAEFKSKKAVANKKESNLDVFVIPKHSPQLNVLDYYLWGEVNKRMRATGRKFSADRREKRTAFLRRLTRTAKSIPAEDILRAQQSMKVRCERLVDAEGGQIEG